MNMLKFSQRPAHTLLFITEAKTFRVDTDRKGVLLDEALELEHGCKSDAALAKTVARIAEQGPPLGKTLWLLFLRLPALMISVPSMQVQGVDEATLAQALQFEAEGMTGVSSSEMRTAYRFLKAEDEMSDYWLVQMGQLAWDDLLKVAKQHKCRLGGVLHPGVLPYALQDSSASEWLRVEAWSTQLLAIHCDDVRMSLLSLGFDNPHWQTELEHWLQERGEQKLTESLLNNRLEMLPDTSEHFALNELQQINQWLGLWAHALIGDKARQVAMLKASANANLDLIWMGGSGAVALVLCALHAGWFLHQRQHYEADSARLSQVEKNLADLRKQISGTKEEKEKLEQKLQTVSSSSEKVPQTIHNLQQRLVVLLEALASDRNPQLIVESLESHGDEVLIGGIALQQQLPNQLADHLSQRLQGLNWRLESPTKENMDLFADGPGPWSFKLKMLDQGVSDLAVSSADTKVNGKPKS